MSEAEVEKPFDNFKVPQIAALSEPVKESSVDSKPPDSFSESVDESNIEISNLKNENSNLSKSPKDVPLHSFKIPHNILSSESAKDSIKSDSEKDSDIEPDQSSDSPIKGTDDDNGQKSESKIKKSKPTKIRIDVPLPYTEPDWSGTPSDLYSLEIIKNGTILEVYNIRTSLTVFGRLEVCNLIFEHPSVSRYHALIQYCKGDSTHEEGFYLYDLGSTHGTFINKDKVTPKIYYKLKVGYVLKFGGSTRLHIFQGPEEEEKQQEKKLKTPKVEEEVCTWGMGDDAEEEEDDLSENPFALSTPNEELYLDDPKKTLRGWFEREGYELEYDCEEKGFKTFSCRIQLPIDTPSGDFMAVEASVSGKKKEAVVACALEACRTLDRLGLLRQSHQESRQKKKKKWEENDYYDSDEDTFLDRTGTIEKKREMRKRIEKKPEAETFESIKGKLKEVTDEINEIARKLSVHKSESQSDKNADDDSLEAYMSTLSDTKDIASDKIERRKLKFRLQQAEKEKSHLEKLLEIARPTKLPPVAKFPGMIGKRLKSKLPMIPPKKKEVIPIVKLNENEEEVEEDSDSETVTSTETAVPSNSSAVTSTETAVPSNSSAVDSSDCFSTKYVDDDEKKTKAYGLILSVAEKSSSGKNSNAEKHKIADDQTASSVPDKIKFEMKKPEISEIKKDDLPVHKKRKKNNKKGAELNTDVYMTESAEYSTWVPPVGQSGDGITHLNSKYGY